MPPLSCDYSEYLCRLFFEEVQPSIEGEQGLTPLKWIEINAWQNVMNVTLSPGEALLIKNLSRDYVSQYSLSLQHDCPAPFQSATMENREVIAKGIKSAFAIAARG